MHNGKTHKIASTSPWKMEEVRWKMAYIKPTVNTKTLSNKTGCFQLSI